MNKFLISSLVAAAAFGLAGCKDSPGSGSAPAAPAAATEPVSIAAITAQAKGFTAGSAMAVRTVYVFFDAQCPHCGTLWAAAKPLKNQAKFVWIPVGLISPASTSQGAALLAAQDPVAAMDEHEALLLDKKGGMTVSGDFEAQKAQVAKNTDLHKRFGFAGVPTIVGTHAQTGALVTQEGAMQTEMAYLQALSGAETWSISATGELTLSGSKGSVLFKPAATGSGS